MKASILHSLICNLETKTKIQVIEEKILSNLELEQSVRLSVQIQERRKLATLSRRQSLLVHLSVHCQAWGPCEEPKTSLGSHQSKVEYWLSWMKSPKGLLKATAFPKSLSQVEKA